MIGEINAKLSYTRFMPRRLLLALFVLVAAPLVLLGWLSTSAYQEQQEATHKQLSGFFQARLVEIDRSLADVLDGYARDLTDQLQQDGNEFATLKSLDRRHPLTRQSIWVDGNDVLLYPRRPSVESSDDFALFAALPGITGSRPDFADRDSANELESDAAAETSPQRTYSSRIPSVRSAFARGSSLPKSLPSKNESDQTGIAGQGQWQVWYMDEGLQLIYWVPWRDGSALGVLLERARWVADLTAALPESSPFSLAASAEGTMTSAGFTALADESQKIVYRWGADGECSETPLASQFLSAPLTSWRLEYHNDNPLPKSSPAPLIVSLAGIGVVLLGLGGYVLTGVQRQMRAARNRVSFASQVSHELRTPLTNIRLYAELAESDLEKLPASDSRSSIEKRLQVIDSESRRLGRLVSGVLEMIRERGTQQGPRIAPTSADDVITQTLLQFEPSFDNASLRVNRDLNASGIVGLDSDILEMILVNLLSNIEKYASDGESVDIQSQLQGGELLVYISDQGPGIPWSKRQTVFRPFARLDDSIHAPSGTGIGLTIARRLARRHGGELVMVPATGGASFELRLPTQDLGNTATDTVGRERDGAN